MWRITFNPAKNKRGKHEMKKIILSFAIIIAIVVSVFSIMPIIAKAETEGIFTYVIEDGEVIITDCDEEASGDVIIPSTIEGYPVTVIATEAVERCKEITSVTIPDSVKIISEWAFADCYHLETVIIPDSVEYIGDFAFSWCDRLTNINVDKDNMYFSSCDGNLFNKDKTMLIQYAIGKSDEIYTIPDGVTDIYDYAFDSSENLSRINIPASVTSVGYDVFCWCYNLNYINVDENNLNYCSIDGNLFNKNKTKMIRYAIGKSNETYTIPDSVTSIGGGTFDSAGNLTELIIPESVLWIGDYAFADCYSLTSISIPAKVSNIGYGAFSWCYNLTSINVNAENQNYCSVDGNLFDKDKTTLIQYAIGKNDTSYTIPTGVTKIDSEAFNENENLISVTIPDGVISIGDYAFSYCYNLTNITIPSSVRSISYGGFFGSDNLTDVYYGGTEEEWNAVEIEDDNDCLLNANIHFGKEPTMEYTPGDVNGDNKIDVKDVVLIRRFVAGGYGVAINETAANVNGDDKLDVKDVIILRRFIAGGYGVELK